MDEVPIIVGQGDMTASTNINPKQNFARPPQCPRCGYDLRGRIELWTNRCPIQGRCSECGLAFRWLEVLNPSFMTPTWWIESRRIQSALVRQMLGTWLFTWNPPLFWTRIRLAHPIRWTRLAAYFLGSITVIVIVLVAAARLFTTASLVDFLTAANWRFWWTHTSPWDMASSIRLLRLSSQVWLCLAVFIATSLAPIGYLTVPVSLRRAKVRFSHLVRISVYGLPFIALPCALALLTTLGLLNSRLKMPPFTESISRWATVASVLMCLLWWMTASSLYLKLQHGIAVGATAVLLPLLYVLFVLRTVELVWVLAS